MPFCAAPLFCEPWREVVGDAQHHAVLLVIAGDVVREGRHAEPMAGPSLRWSTMVALALKPKPVMPIALVRKSSGWTHWNSRPLMVSLLGTLTCEVTWTCAWLDPPRELIAICWVGFSVS